MATQQHTPGPWRISVDKLGYASIRTGTHNAHPDSDLIADVYGESADVTLILAAPDLLEALTEAVSVSDRLAAQRGWQRVPEADKTLSKMRTAIAKALGEPTPL